MIKQPYMKDVIFREEGELKNTDLVMKNRLSRFVSWIRVATVGLYCQSYK